MEQAVQAAKLSEPMLTLALLAMTGAAGRQG
jgi:hypothetical protein